MFFVFECLNLGGLSKLQQGQFACLLKIRAQDRVSPCSGPRDGSCLLMMEPGDCSLHGQASSHSTQDSNN